MNDKVLKIVINGGLVSITLATLYVLYKVLTNDFAHVEMVIQKNNEALISSAVVQEKLGESVTKLGEIIDRKIK